VHHHGEAKLVAASQNAGEEGVIDGELVAGRMQLDPASVG